MTIDNQGKGKETSDSRVERNYSRPSESKPSHSQTVSTGVKSTIDKGRKK